MQREYQSLMDARLKLEAKLTTIKQEREELEALLELAKSKEITAKTMKSLDDLAGVGDADVARIADSIRPRLDRASAESEMRAASLDKQMDDVLDRGELDAQLPPQGAAWVCSRRPGSGEVHVGATGCRDGAARVARTIAGG